jgi:hypothetical protein
MPVTAERDRPSEVREEDQAEPPKGASRSRRIALFVVPPVVLLVLGGLFYGSTGRDDAYLTYWPAHTLATSGKIVNYNGDKVEQSSSLLHVVVLAAISRLTSLSVPATGWIVGLLSGGATVVVAILLARKIESRAGWFAGVFAATSAYLVYWSFGGLETPLAALCCLLAVLGAAVLVKGPASVLRTVGSVSAIAAYATVRPEAIVVLIVLTCAVAVVAALGPRWSVFRPGGNRLPRRGALRLALAVGGVVGVVVLFRLAYFGDFVPQPVHAKVNGLSPGDGLQYVHDWLLAPGVLVLPIVAAGALLQRRCQRSILELVAWLMAACQLGFVIFAGGDWMEAGRMFVPFLAVAAVLAAVTVARTERRALLASAVIAIELVGVVVVARSDSTGKPLWASAGDGGDPARAAALPFFERVNRIHLRDGIFVSHVEDVVKRLHEATGNRISVSSGQAGMVPYYLVDTVGSDARFIDRGDLSGDAFARCSEGEVPFPMGEGKVMPYNFWFSHLDECGVPKPDVIYELGTKPSTAVYSGYTTVYQAPLRKLYADSIDLPGTAVGNGQYIAVRNDLLPLLKS